MRNLTTSTAVLLAGMVLTGSLLAQDAPAAASTPKQSTSATKSATATGAKKSTATTAAAPLVLTTDKQKASYAIGTSIGRKLHDDGLDVDSAVLYRALKDAAAGKKSQLTDEQMQAALMNFQKAAEKAMAAKNLATGNAYRAQFKAKPGVITLPDGLEYRVVKEGTGPKPAETDEVVVNYRGSFVDGKEFDSSYKRNEPTTLPVGGVIKGWTEALKMMPVGSKWELVIPPTLAYGEEGRRGMAPNSTLVFEVELLKIAEKKPAAPELPEGPGAQGSPAKPGAPGAPNTPGSAPAPTTPPATSQAPATPPPASAPAPATPNTSTAPTTQAPQPK